jgi:hypothetical protein
MKTLPTVGFLVVLCAITAMAQSNPVPLISQPVVPPTVEPGHQQFTLTVNGAGFVSTAVVQWNGSARTTEFFSSSKLKATISAADVAQAGTATVTVQNPVPGGGTSNPVLFPVQVKSPSAAMFPMPKFPVASGNAVGDFNGDGISDIVIGGQDITFYPGNGDGTFGKPITSQTVVAVYSLLAGDFNRDGKLDLAALDGLGTVTIYIGNGKGKFIQQQVFREQPGVALQTADFTGDGKLDLAIASYSTIDIRLGKGDGTFGPPTPIRFNQQIGNPAIGDFNGDGVLDVAAPSFSAILVSLGNGDGTFQAPASYQTPFLYQLSAVAADFNGDGKLDIITDAVSVMLGNGDGTFRPANGVQIQNVGWFANIVLGDFDGNGRMDAAVVVYDFNTQASGVDLIFWDEHGNFRDPVPVLPLGNTPIANLNAGDFNQDGKLDLVGAALLLQIPASLSPTSLDFGDQTIGTKSTKRVTLSNDGSTQLNITQISITGDSKDFTQTNDCGTSLPPGGSCRIKVTFAPHNDGDRQGSLRVGYEGLGSPQKTSLTGAGVTTATVSLKPTKLVFATQLLNTTSSPQTSTLTNTGSVDVLISKIAATAPFSQSNDCPNDLAVGASCKIQVSFTPTGKGPASGKLSVHDNAQGSPQTVAVSGVGTVVKLAPSGVTFGDQKVGTKSPAVDIKLTNTSSDPLSIHGITITGHDASDFSQSNNCGTSVPAGGHCTIKLQFAPQQKGRRTAKLASSDDGGGSPQTVPLAGTGT